MTDTKTNEAAERLRHVITTYLNIGLDARALADLTKALAAERQAGRQETVRALASDLNDYLAGKIEWDEVLDAAGLQLDLDGRYSAILAETEGAAMTQERPINLDELERLLEAATPGPWKRSGPGPQPDGDQVWLVGNGNQAQFIAWTDASVRALVDFDLAVAAVNSLPALIAAARRAEALEKALSRITAVRNTRLVYVDHGGNRGQPGECACGIALDGLEQAQEIASAALAGEGAPR